MHANRMLFCRPSGPRARRLQRICLRWTWTVPGEMGNRATISFVGLVWLERLKGKVPNVR